MMIKIIYVVICLLLLCNSIQACTVFNATEENVTLIGRNMDWYTQENYVVFLPAEEGKIGRVYFGWNTYPSWYQGGINTDGLIFAYLAAPYLRVIESLHKPIYEGNFGNLMEKCMEECSSVDDVLALFDNYNLAFLENCQIMVVDRTGNSVIIEGDDMTFKEDSFQVVTNFRPSHPFLGGYPSWRYDIAYNMLDEMTDLKMTYFSEILDATHQEGEYPTQWSIVYNLSSLEFYLYHYHDYSMVIKFNLLHELALGEHCYSIPELFELDNNVAPYKPDKPIGDMNGRINVKYTYTTSAADPNGNDLYYKWDWGDEMSDWFGPFRSGENVSISHIWDEKNSYEIKVKVKDIYGRESPWSDPLIISISKNKIINNNFYDNDVGVGIRADWLLFFIHNFFIIIGGNLGYFQK